MKMKYSIFKQYNVYISILGILLALTATAHYGPGHWPDSANYICAAHCIAVGQDIRGFDGAIFVAWPPLYPAVISFFIRLGGDPSQIVRYMNSLLFGAILFISYYFFRYNSRSRLSLLFLFAILFSYPIQYVSTFAGSEPLFILLTILFLLTIQFYIKMNRIIFIILASVLASFACLSRYIGITLIITGIVIILLQHGKSAKKKILTAGIFGCSAILPLIFWMLRNYALTHTLMGPRYKSDFSLSINFYRAMTIILSWFNPILYFQGIYTKLIAVFVICILLIFFVFVILKLRKIPKIFIYDKIINKSEFVFSLVFVVFLVISASLTAFDAINHRLMAPILIPLMVIILNLYNIAKANKFYKKVNSILFPIISITLIILYMAFASARTYMYVKRGLSNGLGGCSTAEWKSFELTPLLRGHSGRFFSNYPEAVYLLTGRFPVEWSPRVHPYNSFSTKCRDLDNFVQAASSNPNMYLIWFNKVPKPERTFLYPLKELKKHIDLVHIETFKVGVLFRVMNKPDS